MKCAKVLFVILTVVLLGFWGACFFILQPYPKGYGVGAMAPSGTHEAVCMLVEQADLIDAANYLMFPSIESVPTHQDLHLEIIYGQYGTEKDQIIFSTNLPARLAPDPPWFAASMIRWSEDSKQATFIVRGTNLVVDIP